jgi:protein involved in sex pheromone biosynthesis
LQRPQWQETEAKAAIGELLSTLIDHSYIINFEATSTFLPGFARKFINNSSFYYRVTKSGGTLRIDAGVSNNKTNVFGKQTSRTLVD